MEVAKGTVYPNVTTIYDSVPVGPDFAVVRIDVVHENSMDVQLEVQPDDLTRTLRDSQYTQLQWRRT